MLEKEEFLTNQDTNNRGNGNEDPLKNINPHNIRSLYFKEIEKIPLLKHEQELQLARQIQLGEKAKKKLEREEVGFTDEEILELEKRKATGMQATNVLVEHNLRLVISEAKKRRGEGVPFLDLIQEGNIGLQIAAKKFDPEQGNKFSTYAVWWIRGEMGRLIDRYARNIRIPVHAKREIQDMYRVIYRMRQKNGEKPSNKELAQELGWNKEKVEERKKQSLDTMSLDMPLYETEDAEALGDVIKDEQAIIPYEVAEISSSIDELFRLMERLKGKQRKVIEQRYGIKDGQHRTQQEVGDILGVTKQRISQIERAAIKKLKSCRERLEKAAKKRRN